LRSMLRWAAIFILMFTIGYRGWYIYNKKQNSSLLEEFQFDNFEEKSVIVLADGTKINISDNDAEIEYKKQGSEILLNSDSTLYRKKELVTNVGKTPEKKTIYNQIILPFGSYHKLILADATVVWLNSGSRLRYYAEYPNKKRIVYLDGEAYFDVAHDKTKAFIVYTSDIEIKVLGTEFNVKSYKFENKIQTTLISGSVKINSHNKDLKFATQILKPKQQLSIDILNRNMNLSEVDTELYTSWKDGYIKLYQADFNEVVKMLSRYYNIKIQINTSKSFKSLSGKLRRESSIDTVLNKIKLITPFNYNYEKNKIIITE